MLKRFFIVLLSLVFVLPTLAQNLSDEQRDYIDDVMTALEATFETDTYKFEGGQVLDQYLEADGIQMTQELSQNMYGEIIISEDPGAFMILEQQLTQEMAGQEVEILMTMEMLVNEDGLYLQVSDVDPLELEPLYPDEWILLDSASAVEYPGLAGINVEQMNQMIDAESMVTPLIDMKEVARTVDLLDDEEIDGMTMTVYHMIADPELLFSDEYMDTVLGLFNFEAFGVDPSVMDFEIGEDTVVEYTFYISQEDGLLYQMESELAMLITLDGAPLGITGDIVIDQTVNARINIFDVGEEIELPTP